MNEETQHTESGNSPPTAVLEEAIRAEVIDWRGALQSAWKSVGEPIADLKLHRQDLGDC